MKLTVGSLPSSVYWRRRAVVAGGVLVLVLVTTYACAGQSGGSEQGKSAQGGKGAQSAGSSPTAPPTKPIVLTPSPGEASNGAPPFGSGGGGGTNTGATGAGTGGKTGTGAGNGDGSCTDAELSLSLAADPAPVRFGEPSRLILRIRNTANHTCTRDVGAQMQELYIQADKSTLWSSDKCDGKNGQNIVTFEPNALEEYSFSWDGTATDAGCTNRRAVPRGTYRLYGRVGTKTSDPAVLTVA
jgi:hypothetical protein